MLRILVIDDDKLSRIKMKSHLSGHQVVEASSYEEAIARLVQRFDLCFIDLNLDTTSEELDGLKILAQTAPLGIYSVVMSSVEDEAIIEKAYELGCRDYYSKGNEKSSVADTLNRYLLNQKDYLESYLFSEVFPTKSKEQKKILQKIIPILQTEIPLCLLGESGTGKTFLAEEIHKQSKRVGPFVAVNCAALSEELLEAELFGHAKGAYTGAVSDSKGKLALANQGTLFLDEIGSMSKPLQAKLLKAIEEKSFYQINSDKLIRSDFRIISATLDNLEEKIKAGDFRFDLFQRLCGMSVTLLPLRKRTEDLADLIKSEVEKNSANGRRILFSKEAKELMANYQWPGNIRELKRVLQILCTSAKGMISGEEVAKLIEEKDFEISPTLTQKQKEMALKQGLPEFIESIEKEIILEAYRLNNQGVRKTLAQLKINQAKLYKYIKGSDGGNNETL